MTLTGGTELSHGMSYGGRGTYYSNTEIIIFQATSTSITITNNFTSYSNIYGGTLIQLN